MEIKPVGDIDSDFESVYMWSGRENVEATPHCKKHGAMNKITSDGIWRCITVAGFQRVIVGNAIGEKHRETICRSACKQVS